jgi:formylglycine-generating enzyme required for sulfatase activity
MSSSRRDHYLKLRSSNAGLTAELDYPEGTTRRSTESKLVELPAAGTNPDRDYALALLESLGKKTGDVLNRALGSGDARLWIEYENPDIDGAHWETLGLLPSERGLQVLRKLSEGARSIGVGAQPARTERLLRKTLVLVGSIAQEGKAADARAQTRVLLQHIATKCGAEGDREVVFVVAGETAKKLGKEFLDRIGAVVRHCASDFVAEVTAHRDAELLIVVGHACDLGSGPDASTGSLAGADTFVLAAPFGDPARASAEQQLHVDDLAEALGADTHVRLALLLSCNTSLRIAAALGARVDHVVGWRGPFEPLAAKMAGCALIDSITGRSSQTVGASVRAARHVLFSQKDQNPALADEWWRLAHWARHRTDEPFVDEIAARLDRVRGAQLDEENAPRANGIDGIDDSVALHYAVTLRVGSIDVDQADGRHAGAKPRTNLAFDQPERERHRRDFLELVVAFDADAGAWRTVPGVTVVRGPAGSGKSTSCLLVTRLLASGQHGSILVLFARLASLDAANTQSVEALARHVRMTTVGLEDTISEPDFLDLVRKKRASRELVLLLDGLDEVVDEAQHRDVRKFAKSLVPDRNSGSPAARAALEPLAVVITTRPDDYQDFGGLCNEAVLEPLSASQQRTIAQEWFRVRGHDDPEGSARSMVEWLESDTRVSAAMRELLRLPLFWSMAAERVASGVTPDLTKVHKFVDDIVRARIVEGHRSNKERALASESRSEDAAFALLAHIAFEMTREGREVDVPVESVHTWLRAAEPQRLLREEWRGDDHEFLNRCHVSGLFASTSRLKRAFVAGSRWRFQHRYFKEALASHAFVSSVAAAERPVTAASLVASAGDRAAATWRQPFALVASRLADTDSVSGTKEASEWVEALLRDSKTHSIGLEAIALADGLEPDVLVLAIEKLETWQEMRDLTWVLAYPESNGDSQKVRDALLRRAKGSLSRFPRREACIELDVIADLFDELALRRNGARRAVGSNPVVQLLIERRGSRLAPLDLRTTEVGADESTLRRVPWLARIDGGTFTMGSPLDEAYRNSNEGPVEAVPVSNFWIARTTTTRGELAHFTGRSTVANARHPALLDFYAARLYCRWLTALAVEGVADIGIGEAERARIAAGELVFRLPKEAEWEFAARGRDVGGHVARAAYGSVQNGDAINASNLARVAVFGPRKPVGSREPTTSAELYDMHGNVNEWTLDAHGPELSWLPADRFNVGRPRARRVLRGGSGSYWFDARGCRSACRYGDGPGLGDVGFGFRVVLAPPLARL